ncbi:uncharacterized protein [Brachyistius frenatus]|uniref:uncharacterized protein n=1 Tax=Brachyistius frenatus TaxID=100188 RepID=UPI0037E9C875
MDWLLWLSVLLTHLPVTESMEKAENCLSQPKMMWQKTGQAAVLSCTISSQCSAEPLHYVWFVFKENSHRRVNLTASKYSLHGASLHIKSLNAEDSGIYHCAAASDKIQHVGLGTTLVVSEKVKIVVRNILLWISCVLLAIYSVAIVILILLKKYGYDMNISSTMCKTGKNNSNKTAQFHDVLQEMSSRGKLEKRQQAGSGNHSHIEAASSDFSISSDGIYQNV